ncbi:glutathione S-transferase [Pseudooceanicola sp.]|uniref:glutathione S-transferase n=1 Tax=Pseudooceanicola sp. TaxID=1914328 RepID=UPI00261BB9F9|nr:glutathione S-transferase [Pseudooceanicola sp.]MDF1855407.1 glutathione S-transferase [Pseudooceanicola sp.]
MKLMSSPASPFVRKVRVQILESGLTDQIEEIFVSTTPTNSDPDLIAANPLAKLPSLIRDDGPTLYDSRVITRYLDAKSGAGLYPEARLWEVLTLEATADGILDSAVSMIYEHRVRPPEMVFDGWIEAQWSKVERAVKVVNDRWMSHLAGPLDMGQVGIACALGYLDFRHPDRGWRDGNGALDDWYATFVERPAMQATIPG